MHDFDLRTEALGQVHCGSLKDTLRLDLPNAPIMLDADGFDFSRQVLRLVGNKNVNKDNQESLQVRREERLTEEEINQITDAEVEIFAREFIAHNKWLLQSYENGDHRDKSNADELDSRTRTTIDLQQGVDESSANYLVRIYRRYIAEQRKRLKKLATTVMGKTSQQLGYGTLMEANRYLAETSATSAIETIMKREQDLIRSIDPFKDMKSHIEGYTKSMAMDHFKHEQDLLRTATSSFADEKHYLAEDAASALMAKDIYRNMDSIRETALELAQRSASSGIIAQMEKQQQEFRNLLKSHEAMFRLPKAFEATSLIESYQVGAVAEFANRHAKEILDQKQLLEAITTPWLHREEAERSVTAILELQGIGNALRTTKGFDPEFTTVLRSDLGDWRDKITFPKSVFIDPVARTDFYVNRGFNSALTDFPEAAFHQSLEITGLDGNVLDMELYGEVTPRSATPEEAGLKRTNRCHDRLQRFERLLRQFIDNEMTARYGPNWPKKQLPSKVFERWAFKKQQAERSGVKVSYIDVADFTDYETVICKKDNWREVFEVRFKKIESVRESLQRLQPIRITTMHSRIATKEDELYLVAEIMRLCSAIK